MSSGEENPSFGEFIPQGSWSPNWGGFWPKVEVSPAIQVVNLESIERLHFAHRNRFVLDRMATLSMNAILRTAR
jgi:hypothetical protein